FAPRSSVPSRLVSRRSACTKEAPRRFASERSAPRKFALFKNAPCRLTPVKSACARFTPHKSALVPDSPPDSAQILCWSKTSARSSRVIPRDSSAGEISAGVALTFDTIRIAPPYTPLPGRGRSAANVLAGFHSGLGPDRRLVVPQFGDAAEHFIVSQKPCGNLLLRGTGPRRGNVTPMPQRSKCLCLG